MKMSDKGVDSSEIVMLPSLQKGLWLHRCAKKIWFLRAIVVHSVWNWLKKSHFTTLRAKRASLGYFKLSLLKEIGILKHSILRKSQKIGKIENLIQKRHLAIFWFFLFVFEFFEGWFSKTVLSWKSVLKGKNIPCANAINPDTIITSGHEFSELYRRQGNFHLSFFWRSSQQRCSFAYVFFGSINLCLTCCRDP